jgi:hypothetical protein
MIDESIFQHHTVALDDVRLHYVIAGSGEPVVLLHGWPQTWFEWRRIIPALAAKYTVVAPDLRGLGDSSKPPSGYDKRTVAGDIYKLVRKLGLERTNLVGLDLTRFRRRCWGKRKKEFPNAKNQQIWSLSAHTSSALRRWSNTALPADTPMATAIYTHMKKGDGCLPDPGFRIV